MSQHHNRRSPPPQQRGGGPGNHHNHHPPHHQQPRSQVNTAALHNQPPIIKVLDMGLDFRSYAAFLDANGEVVLGNVVSYNPDILAEVFEPTVGLLVTVLQLYHRSSSVRDAPVWLSAYQSIQQNIIETFGDKKPEVTRYAEEAVKAITTGSFSTANGADPKLVEKLFILLDGQSGQRGGQCPSQRQIPSQPKGMFCNLHLSDHKCNQEFSCNQFHLRKATNGGIVRHRLDFHLKLIDALLSRGVQIAEIQHRVKDSLFYAKFGNRVTVPFGGQWIPFFKTLFSADRLPQALRMVQPGTPANILIQQEGRVQGSKMLELSNPKDALAEIEMSTATIFQIYEQNKVAANPPQAQPTQQQSVPAQQLELPASPTGEGWTAAIRNYMKEHATTESRANEALLTQLQGAARPSGGTPVTPDQGFTPLLREADMMRFDSASSLDITSPTRNGSGLDTTDDSPLGPQ